MSRTVRFIHTADLHLGSPLRTVGSEALRQRLNDATYQALERIVSLALAEAVDFILFAGDLYDYEARSVRANQQLVDQLQRLDEAGIPSFIIYGNHDPVGDRGELLDLPQSVTVFGHEQVETAGVADEDGRTIARVLGQSYRQTSESRKMYPGFTPPADGAVNVGLLHTGLDPESNVFVPCSAADLASKTAIDYWALGHVHTAELIRQQAPAAAYCGIPQGRDIGETGVGGCLLVEAEPGEDPAVHFVPVAPVVWRRVRVDLGDVDSEQPLRNVDDVYEQLRQHAAGLLDSTYRDLCRPLSLPAAAVRSGAPDGYVLRFRLTGRCQVHEALASSEEAEVVLEERLQRQFGQGSPFLWTDSVDIDTAAPRPDLETLAASDPVIAELRDLVEQASREGQLRQELVEKLTPKPNSVWALPGRTGEEPDRHLALTDERLDRLLAAARELAIDRILKERPGRVD